ncbi:MAG: enoyl-CoA hydratase family protein [Planctomycetes bacterium]|nr:enoyl-CoA hydratase family protein [Planctomycetota bacterium]MCB9916701.1 enoyl-CoA hydratase family protein [Planctomycetota bacterium]
MPESFHEQIDDDGVSLVTLDRPERYNALTFEVYRELADRFAAMQHDDAVHAVVITGAGKAFCSGGDVHDIIGRLFEVSEEETLAFTRMTGELIANMRKLRKPILAAVNGMAAGAGAVIALASDLRVFAQTAKIAFLFTNVGLTGADMGAGYLLPRVVGQGRASELLLLGNAIDAATAERYGLANQVVPRDECLPTAMALGQRLAKGPLAALASTKHLIDAEWSLDLDTAIEIEALAQAMHLRQPDHKRFHAAFVAKRPPRFSGEIKRHGEGDAS